MIEQPLASHYLRAAIFAEPSTTAAQARRAARAKEAAAVLVMDGDRIRTFIPVEHLAEADAHAAAGDLHSATFARAPRDARASELRGAGVPWFVLTDGAEILGVVAKEWLEPREETPRTRGGVLRDLNRLDYGYSIPQVFGPSHVETPTWTYHCPVDGEVYDFATSRKHLKGGEVMCATHKVVMTAI